jgi:hypothetical protein
MGEYHESAGIFYPGPGRTPATPNTALTGAIDDINGRSLAIHHDHDGVRIDTAGIEIMLTRGQSRALRALLEESETESAIWEGWQEVSRDA